MKGFRVGCLLLLAGAILSTSGPVLADTMSVSNSDDGFGSSYKLTAVCVGSLCSVTLSIDTKNAKYSDISSVAFKIGSNDSLTATLSAPTADPWSTSSSSLNSNSGCGGKNGDGQICSYATGGFADTGGMLTWNWTGVQVNRGDMSIGHVGYKYETSETMGKGLIVSDDYSSSSPVPEPHALSLLVTGILVLVLSRKLFQG